MDRINVSLLTMLLTVAIPAQVLGQTSTGGTIGGTTGAPAAGQSSTSTTGTQALPLGTGQGSATTSRVAPTTPGMPGQPSASEINPGVPGTAGTSGLAAPTAIPGLNQGNPVGTTSPGGASCPVGSTRPECRRNESLTPGTPGTGSITLGPVPNIVREPGRPPSDTFTVPPAR